MNPRLDFSGARITLAFVVVMIVLICIWPKIVLPFLFVCCIVALMFALWSYGGKE
jgi:hypothetical protein